MLYVTTIGGGGMGKIHKSCTAVNRNFYVRSSGRQDLLTRRGYLNFFESLWTNSRIKMTLEQLSDHNS